MASCTPTTAAYYREYLAQNCEYLKMYARLDGDTCSQALEAFYVCISMADCAEFASEMASACQEELTATEAACPSLFSEPDTDTAGGTGDPDSTSG